MKGHRHLLIGPGRYYVEQHEGDRDARLSSFEVQAKVLERQTLSNVIHDFKGQRSSGVLDQVDRQPMRPDGQPSVPDRHVGGTTPPATMAFTSRSRISPATSTRSHCRTLRGICSPAAFPTTDAVTARNR